MSYRPSGVVVIGVFMIIFAVLNIFWAILMMPLSGTSLITLFSPFTLGGLLSFGLMLTTSVMLVVGATGLLSMARWGYYTGLAASIVLIVSAVFSFFVGFGFFLISIGGLILGIITLTYLLTDVKYEYPIDLRREYPARYEYPERRRTMPAAKIVSVPEPIPVAIKPKPDCLYCGTEIPEDAEFCPHCGEARVRCPVCSKDIVSGDRFVKCPYCGALNHREHLLEWIKVKGYCPNCKRKLKETDIA
ncbi:MAG: zinc ribbon domain-containing protein [Candidatus Freyarchaeum deiterrae]